MRFLSFPLLCLCLIGCPSPSAGQASDTGPALELVETWPLETGLDHEDIPDAVDVWPAMFRAAETSIDLGMFYSTAQPDVASGPLRTAVEALEAAAARGVKVRCLFDAVFYGRGGNMAEIPDRLREVEGIEVRIIDFAGFGGGVMHAKYFVVDDTEAYVGSQNFDWRSLRHISELGLRLREPALVDAVAKTFAFDWDLAEPGVEPAAALENARRHSLSTPGPVAVAYGADSVVVTPVLSSRDLLPTGARWDLEALLERIGAAEERVRVQLLNYKTRGFSELDDALRAAAARGVEVQLMVSNWMLGPKMDWIKELQALDHFEVRIVSIPAASTGFIPFARVIHAKLMTVDGHHGWVGTSNWSKDYFYAGRNVGFLIDGPAFAGDLDRVFESVWDGEYAATLDPDKEYVKVPVAEEE